METILNQLADILRENGYKVYKKEQPNEDSLPTIHSWIHNTDISVRAYNSIVTYYTSRYLKNGVDRSMMELIEDVRSSKITKYNNVGDATRIEIANALRSSLGIDI